jgi:hypothetical protein
VLKGLVASMLSPPGGLMTWAEPLPADCPPVDAFKPQGQPFYRMIENPQPSESDFYSLRKLNPTKKYGFDECIAMAISVFDKKASCQQLRLLPIYKGRFKNRLMIEIILNSDCGLIKQTGKTASHYSWWLLQGYNPIAFYKVLSD